MVIKFSRNIRFIGLDIVEEKLVIKQCFIQKRFCWSI